MHSKKKLLLAGALVVAATTLLAFTGVPAARKQPPATLLPAKAPRIQVAILLDVSGSMSGLLEQAKNQLWNMVSLLGKAECPQGAPRVEIALYQYGQGDDSRNGYMRQLSPFTTDLDSLSKILFSLHTSGSEEYCPQVILRSAGDLGWDTAATTYRAIFIAGNETFRQGPVTWLEACQAARAKDIVVNTIYCGEKAEGIRDFWDLAGECGKGSYTHINHNAQTEDPPTPYDSALITLNTRLNRTMIGYGYQGDYNISKVAAVDKMNAGRRAASMKRMEVKANKKVYRNDSWEMVDAYESDSTSIARLDRNTLPDSLRKLTVPQLQALARNKLNEREAIRNEIGRVSRERADWLEAERKKNIAAATAEATLESEMERLLKVQVQAKGYTIK